MMMPTAKEKEILQVIQQDPLLSVEEIAHKVNVTRASASVHLSNLSKKGWLLGRGFIVRENQNVLVVGGANMDYKHQLFENSKLETSNPSQTQSSAGGVGRNIAQNLAQLGINVEFLSVIGLDPLGEQLLNETRATGVQTRDVKRSQTHTGTYSAILEPNGELVIAIAAMDILEELDSEYLQSKQPLLEHASFIVIDSNIPESSLSMLVEIARERDWQLIIDPVSVAKAKKVRHILGKSSIHTLTPNQAELAVLVNKNVNTDQDILEACQDLHANDVINVWVRLGSRGGLFSSHTGESHWIAALRTKVTDVTGAGDAALAGYLYAVMQGETLEQACYYGQATASLTLSTHHTVNPELNPQKLKKLVKQNELRSTL